MSLEKFERIFPANANIEGIVKTWKQPVESPIATLCRVLVDEASQELRDLSQRIPRIVEKIDPAYLNMLFGLPEGTQESIRYHYAAIVFGTAGQSVYRTLLTRTFNKAHYAMLYNKAIFGTRFEPLHIISETVDPPQEVNMEDMYAQVQEDGTFCSFFESKEGLLSLPTWLRAFVDSTRILPDIQTGVLPIYKDRAQLLVPAPSHVKKLLVGAL